MTVQMPRQPKSANPFLNSLDTPAFRPSNRVITLDRQSGSAEHIGKPSLLKSKPSKGPSPVLLACGLVTLLLAWPVLSNWTLPKKPESKSIFKAIPVQYTYISSTFGPRWGRMHQGIDFAAQAGSPIYAASSGKVIQSGWESGYGNSVVIEHGDGRQTRYAHCAQLLVQTGEQVSKGKLIAKVGSTGHSTGPHLHFEVIVNGEHKNPAWYYPLGSAQRIASE